MSRFATYFSAMFLIALWALMLGCPPSKPVPPIPVNGDECERAETRLKPAPEGLGCTRPDGSPFWVTKKGKPFSTFCRDRMENGDFINGDCISRITSCDDLEKASRTPRGTSCP
jgi:hypothetical protein